MHNELITIGIPVYNMEKSILMAINSCLKQSYKNLEILIVDDGSSDNSIKVIKQNISDSRVRIYQRQQNGGVCAAMQDLVVQAKGEYICFLDADDTMMSTRVEKQYRAIKSAEKRYPSRMIASFCGSEVNDITAGEKYRIDPNDLWNISAKHSFGGGTGHSMYRVADLKKLGNFDSRFSRSADSAMCVLFLMNGGFYAMVPEPLIIYNFYWDKNKKDISEKERKIFAELQKEVLVDNPRNLYLQRFAGITNDCGCKKSEIKLFGVIPLLTIRRKKKKIWLRLFGFIPFIQIKNKK